jgi:hypothetical protein
MAIGFGDDAPADLERNTSHIDERLPGDELGPVGLGLKKRGNDAIAS